MKSIKGEISKRDDVFKCDKCDKIFKSKDGHKSHLKNSQCNIENFSIIPANDEKVMFYKCNICGTSFLSKKLCLDHCNKFHMKNQKEVKELLRNNTTAASYKCEICEKKFKTEKHNLFASSFYAQVSGFYMCIFISLTSKTLFAVLTYMWLFSGMNIHMILKHETCFKYFTTSRHSASESFWII